MGFRITPNISRIALDDQSHRAVGWASAAAQGGQTSDPNEVAMRAAAAVTIDMDQAARACGQLRPERAPPDA
jgi:hypothetical protein